jgi:hemoglobin-like flavoprotein
MTSEQIKLIKKTWKIMMGVDPKIIGDAFYSKLFVDHPALRKMFPTDMEKQYVKLVDMLTSIIMHLDYHTNVDMDKLTEISKKHVAYGVKTVHYDMVGNALLWTLKKGLGFEWSQDVNDAWTECYRSLTNTMFEND